MKQYQKPKCSSFQWEPDAVLRTSGAPDLTQFIDLKADIMGAGVSVEYDPSQPENILLK